ncbi:MAG: acid phosphatase [Chlorobi bacterium]|nr:acid phosphatase [Chlorobiota bacterium]
MFRAVVIIMLCTLLFEHCNSASGGTPGAHPPPRSGGFDIGRIKHVIVIYQENWSFDGLYSQFPGTDRTPFGTRIPQFDGSGRPIDSMNIPCDNEGRPFTGSAWKGTMPVIFYSLDSFNSGANPYTNRSHTRDITHRFYHHPKQIDAGRNDRFLYWSDSSTAIPNGRENMNALTFGAVDASNLQVGKLAQKYTMCDRCFQSVYGGSFINHQWLVSARMPVCPETIKNAGNYISDPANPLPGKWDNKLSATPARDRPGYRYAINTVFPPFPPTDSNPKHGLMIPPLTDTTIGDRMSAANVSWKWYAQGWNEAMKTPGDVEGAFQVHHQPFNYYQNFNPSTREGAANRLRHLADLDASFHSDLDRNTLPAVSFIKLTNLNDQHPDDADIRTGDSAVATLVRDIQSHPAIWADCAIIITFDEFGGRWDHVPPQPVDEYGPATRIPMIIISPFARLGYVDTTHYETVSILAFIEKRWGLAPLTARDRNAGNLLNAFATSPAEERKKRK